jgi:hypothetical protein
MAGQICLFDTYLFTLAETICRQSRPGWPEKRKKEPPPFIFDAETGGGNT